MLDTHRQAHHAFAHTRLGQFFWVELAVRGGRGVRGQRLGIAEFSTVPIAPSNVLMVHWVITPLTK